MCNAPRPLFGEEHTILNAPFGFSVTVARPFGDDQRQRELLWENHRQDATVLWLVTVEEARRLADSMRTDGSNAMPDIWERVWREAFYDYFRVDVTHEALIREWPRLREWLDEDREGLRLHTS